MKLPLITALCAELPPGGKPRNAAFKLLVSENKLRPSSPRFARSFPPGGSRVNKALIFRFFRGGELRDYYRYKYQRAAAKFYGGKRFL